ncbi:MAG: DMT family transporter [Flexistipes sinusarabici]|uniref:DMT family transporter n=1 Tax=Flexistipes sinusarabici TaxID=2352 RepID=A0A5D0MLM1_FLESI|nr:DMT family transporter [Flexistipes sinusarabici]TYB33906.1 MAG: DMT family transporter [Flexistipes sinusarabici]
MSKYLVYVLLVVGGTFVSLQASINARLAKYVGFVESAFISFTVGTMVLAAAVLLKNENGLKHIFEVPPVFLTGGMLGACFVFIITYSVHVTGVASALATAIGVQLLVGLLIDKYNPMNVIKLDVHWYNVLGVLFIILGIILLTRGR